VEVDEEPGHRVEETVAVRPRSEREPGEEASELERMGEVLGDEDGRIVAPPVGDPDGPDRGQPGDLELAEDAVLPLGDPARLLLERVDGPLEGQEADEMAGRADGDLPEAERCGPPGERELPRKVEEGSGPPQAQRGRVTERLRSRWLSGMPRRLVGPGRLRGAALPRPVVPGAR
jgi:hypothetical protein